MLFTRFGVKIVMEKACRLRWLKIWTFWKSEHPLVDIFSIMGAYRGENIEKVYNQFLLPPSHQISQYMYNPMGYICDARFNP